MSPTDTPVRQGTAVAVGDFDGDGVADIAAGAPGYNGKLVDEGGVYAYRGRRTGGVVNFANHLLAPLLLVSGGAFGSALAAGDFDGKGRRDLAIGAPYDRPNNVGNAGSVSVFFGSASGLATTGEQYLAQGRDGTFGHPRGATGSAAG